MIIVLHIHFFISICKAWGSVYSTSKSLKIWWHHSDKVHWYMYLPSRGGQERAPLLYPILYSSIHNWLHTCYSNVVNKRTVKGCCSYAWRGESTKNIDDANSILNKVLQSSIVALVHVCIFSTSCSSTWPTGQEIVSLLAISLASKVQSLLPLWQWLWQCLLINLAFS